MKALFKLELRQAFISRNSLIVFAIFIGLAFVFGRYVDFLSPSDLLNSLFLIYLFIGMIVASSLFSGIISNEIETQTIRYVVPYQSRGHILIVKYVTVLIYFFILIGSSILTVLALRRDASIPVQSLLFIIGAYIYSANLIVLISVLCKTEKKSIISAILVSIMLPTFSIMNMLKPSIIFKGLNKLTPYAYIDKSNGFLILIGLAVFMGVITIFVFNRKEV
ncbi:hypothetical protein [Weissella minor]|uniref:Uncharacterized protein n=1 Tax=Weissella minor TaxID=1620 RepID=A0A0R2JRL4_9LACO|nr:hypothetical protein [Weissella minor]KRN76868.1 hypothetical protein IV67_GL000377 [Weissella minor]